MQRIEIVGEPRRAHNAAFRARVFVGEHGGWRAGAGGGAPTWHLHEPDLSMAAFGRAAGRLASAAPLVPVRVTEPRAPQTQVASVRPVAEAQREGVIEIELRSGVRVRVGGEMSLAALRRVMTVLRG